MLFAINILLTLVWAGLIGSIDTPTLLSGFVLGFAALRIVYGSHAESTSYFSKPLKIVAFLGYYAIELVRSNLIIAIDILTPTHRMRPGVVAIPIDAKTDIEITLLANLITMTPGTLSLDVSKDRKTLYVHAMYIKDADQLRQSIKNDLERRVLDILR